MERRTKRTMVALLTVALLALGGPARAESGSDEPCNLKALENTADHLAHATDPDRIAMLQDRYDRLLARCSMPPPHD
jgi:hypothetical protein